MPHNEDCCELLAYERQAEECCMKTDHARGRRHMNHYSEGRGDRVATFYDDVGI